MHYNAIMGTEQIFSFTQSSVTITINNESCIIYIYLDHFLLVYCDCTIRVTACNSISLLDELSSSHDQ